MARILSLVGALATLVDASLGSSTNCTGLDALSPACPSPETGHTRDVFYVGGEYWDDGTGNRTAGQLYVERLTPLGGATKPTPLVLLHGGGTTAASWLTTPDNRKGFASLLLDAGFQVFLTDQVSVGRSAQTDAARFAPYEPGMRAEDVERAFSGPAHFPASYPQAALHTQFPGRGLRGDGAFEQFARAMPPYSTNATAMEAATRVAGCALLARIGVPVVLVSHSAGATYAVLLANDCGARFVAGSVNLEPATTPFFFPTTGALTGIVRRPWGLTGVRIDYEPPVVDPAAQLAHEEVGENTLGRRSCYRLVEARRLPKINAVPYLLVTAEASVHATYDHCVIAFLEQTGGSPEWIRLAEDRGIRGNGHFMHLEKNNREIAGVVEEWIRKVEAERRL